eukprot:g77850.t1
MSFCLFYVFRCLEKRILMWWTWFGVIYVFLPLLFWTYLLCSRPLRGDQLTWRSGMLCLLSGLLCGSVAFYLLCVLAGAPLLSMVEETALISVSLAWLCAVPGALVCRDKWSRWLRVYLSSPTSLQTLDGVLQLSTLSTLAGTMMGAYFLVLDHGTPWQEWPSPCLVGSLVGFCVSPAVLLVRGLNRNLTSASPPRVRVGSLKASRSRGGSPRKGGSGINLANGGSPPRDKGRSTSNNFSPRTGDRSNNSPRRGEHVNATSDSVRTRRKK